MDVHSALQRSKNMSAIKSSGTKSEVFLAKALWVLGHRYRKNNKTVFGKPDFTFKKIKLAIFVDSEFFHGKDFETKKKPATNAEFWEKKILRNIARDIEVNNHLKENGWTVLRFWSTEVRKNLPEVIAAIEHEITLKKNLQTLPYSQDSDVLPLAAEPENKLDQ
jgi:DNA mismatch endonuclease (patch repair protein)